MALIGTFTCEGDRFFGRIHTLTLYREITIVPAEESDAENAPDYRVHHGADDGPDIGPGWKEVGEKAGEFVSLLIDDPAFAYPMRAKLFRSASDPATWTLHWNRPKAQSEKGRGDEK